LDKSVATVMSLHPDAWILGYYNLFFPSRLQNLWVIQWVYPPYYQLKYFYRHFQRVYGLALSVVGLSVLVILDGSVLVFLACQSWAPLLDGLLWSWCYFILVLDLFFSLWTYSLTSYVLLIIVDCFMLLWMYMVKFICTHKSEDEMYYSNGLKVYEQEFHLVIMH